MHLDVKLPLDDDDDDDEEEEGFCARRTLHIDEDEEDDEVDTRDAGVCPLMYTWIGSDDDEIQSSCISSEESFSFGGVHNSMIS